LKGRKSFLHPAKKGKKGRAELNKEPVIKTWILHRSENELASPGERKKLSPWTKRIDGEATINGGEKFLPKNGNVKRHQLLSWGKVLLEATTTTPRRDLFSEMRQYLELALTWQRGKKFEEVKGRSPSIKFRGGSSSERGIHLFQIPRREKGSPACRRITEQRKVEKHLFRERGWLKEIDLQSKKKIIPLCGEWGLGDKVPLMEKFHCRGSSAVEEDMSSGSGGGKKKTVHFISGKDQRTRLGVKNCRHLECS